MAAAQQFFERGYCEMRFSHARRTHKQKAFFAGTGIITDESLRDEFYLLERLCMLCRPDFSIGEISDVTFKVAMLVALWDPRAIHGQRSAFAAAAVAGDGEFSRAIRSRDQLPSGSVAQLAILERHRRTSIRACAANGKPRRMWICVKEKKDRRHRVTELRTHSGEKNEF